jgi:hypothetical protein
MISQQAFSNTSSTAGVQACAITTKTITKKG